MSLIEYKIKTAWPNKRYKNISWNEWACSHSGRCVVDKDFLDRLQALRTKLGFPLIITSGYRSETHPVEAKKKKLGAHTTGKAVDIKIHGAKAWELLMSCSEFGFTGIGLKQTGDMDSRFIHLDTMTEGEGFPRPWVWTY
jgi:zinc D-Ala-D-Ala carboxypeptidase